MPSLIGGGGSKCYQIPQNRGILCLIRISHWSGIWCNMEYHSPPQKKTGQIQRSSLSQFPTLHRITPPPPQKKLSKHRISLPKMDLLMEDFVQWTGVWRLLLYPTRILYRFTFYATSKTKFENEF